MTIDEAVALLDPSHVLWILNSGHAQDAGRQESFRGRATMAWLKGRSREQAAFLALADAWEADVRQACKSPERLEREFLEDGSGRAFAEIQRRGLPLPQSAALQPAWL